MNRNLRYNKSFQRAIICLSIATATIIYIAAIGTALAASPTSDSIFGMNRFTATLTLFFVPSATGLSIMLGINLWFTSKIRTSFGW